MIGICFFCLGFYVEELQKQLEHEKEKNEILEKQLLETKAELKAKKEEIKRLKIEKNSSHECTGGGDENDPDDEKSDYLESFSPNRKRMLLLSFFFRILQN